MTRRRTIPALALAAASLAGGGAAAPAPAQNTSQAVAQLERSFTRLRFAPPTPRQVRLSNGVTVFLVEDHDLPTLNVNIVSRAGVGHLPDSLWAVGWAADNLMRTGGTTALTPDSVDRLVEFYALGVGFSTGNEVSTAFVGGLSRYQDQMLDLVFDMMRNPRNDTARLREDVAQREEQWRRRNDQPGSILNRAWLQVMYGDHPFARTLIKPDELPGWTPERFRRVQNMLYCPDKLVIGITGDFEPRALTAKLESLFRGWGRCPAGTREIPAVRFADGPRIVFIEKDVNQTNIRMGHAGGLRVSNTPDYFAAEVADFLLGGGGGFNSRLLQRVRSDSGFAYSTFSVWGAETRREGLFFAGAQTRANKTVAAISLMRQIIGSMVSEPVTADDVRLAQDNESNAFVFRFEEPDQVVGQQLQYVVDGLPPNWFDLYLQGIQSVTPEQVRDVSRRLLRPDRLVMVVVGNPAQFDAPLSTLGNVTTMRVEDIER